MLLAFIAALIGSTLQSATGFGFALVLGPALFGVLEPEEALTTLLILGTVLNLMVLLAEGREREIHSGQLSVILAAAVPGVLIGVLVLRALSKPTLQVAVGIAVVIAVAIQVKASRRTVTQAVPTTPTLGAATVGLTTGFLTTSTGTSGPPLVLWFQRLGLDPTAMRDTLAAAFLALNVLGATALFTIGEDPGAPSAADLVVLLVLTIAGYVGGRELFHRLSSDAFRTAGLVLVVAAGIASVIAGLSG